MEHAEQELIQWKTNAWKDPSSVSLYSGRMVENSGTVRLKNKIEVALCERFVTGESVLDVGIGTGRASVGLIKQGYRVTGIDSSQAMLDECRRLAGSQPIELVPGDVSSLPFSSEQFDSLISLNVMTHFPHLEKVLREWQRVVKPKGRIIFDIYSLDHLSFARGQTTTIESIAAQGIAEFNMHIGSERLVSAANQNGLKIVSVVPYGSLFSGEYNHWQFPMPLQKTSWWRRQLSWIPVDDAMLEFAHFLDREWFGRLTDITTGRFMVVLENSSAETDNLRWRVENEALNERLAHGDTITLAELAPRLGIPIDEWRDEFDRHLDHMRNRTVAYFLLTTFARRADAVDWTDLAPRNGKELQRWADAEAIDKRVQEVAYGWHRQAAIADQCKVYGVDLGACLDYDLQRKLIGKIRNFKGESGQ